ncbi:primosomal protein N', partial [candidate division KSB1 bacterium]
ARWMSAYYFTAPGEILQMMLPVRIDRSSVELISLTEKGLDLSRERLNKLHPVEGTIVRIIKKCGKTTPDALKQEVGYHQLFYRLERLNKQGLLTREYRLSSKKPAPKIQLFLRPLLLLSSQKQKDVFKRAKAQEELYNYIVRRAPVTRSTLLRQFPGRESSLNGLIDKQVVEKYGQEVTREYEVSAPDTGKELPPLTGAQKEIVSSIASNTFSDKFKVFLLHGVTGSGKTRVYLELIHRVLDKGRGVLFLVPEIALTNYFLAGLRAQFGDRIAVLHSKMSQGERYDSWRGILTGSKRLVIGPRSAVFAPVHDLGLIIVDEEHDSSYKQHETPPYYHARDVAVYRARLTGSHIILGSATPSMETYYNAVMGKYRLLELPERIDRTPLPEVRLIDMCDKIKQKPAAPPGRIFSSELLGVIEERLRKGEQVLLMLNRRGYSTFIQCRDCGHIETCPDCKITLTFHKKKNTIQCHFCGYTHRAPSVCPDCSGNNIRYSGIGTQQIEEALHMLIPGYSTIRMDQDTTRSRSAHRHITAQFDRGESDILVGTQMVAKGFDFARVNLVGVISADTGLFFPEFRAAEKTFQLMTQAAGRAGRRKERGMVIIQTLLPDHYSLTATVRHDFHRFYEEESKIRAELNYPPYGRIILLRFAGRDEQKVCDAAVGIGNSIRKTDYRKYMLGPAPAPIEKIRKMYRWFIFLKSGKDEDSNGKKIQAAARTALSVFNRSAYRDHVILTIDVDPINLL